MAYLTLVAAVPEVQVASVRSDAAYVLAPTMINGVSHLLSYSIQVQPLGQILNSVIDGGDCLHKDFWHPLRPPMVHLPFAVPRLTETLEAAWGDFKESSAEQDEWLSAEIARLLAIMNHATETGTCIVTALDFPRDHDRLKRVRIPWLPPTADDGAPRRSWWKLW